MSTTFKAEPLKITYVIETPPVRLLRLVRTVRQIPQEKAAEDAGVSVGALQNAEQGTRCTKPMAHALVNGMELPRDEETLRLVETMTEGRYRVTIERLDDE